MPDHPKEEDDEEEDEEELDPMLLAAGAALALLLLKYAVKNSLSVLAWLMASSMATNWFCIVLSSCEIFACNFVILLFNDVICEANDDSPEMSGPLPPIVLRR